MSALLRKSFDANNSSGSRKTSVKLLHKQLSTIQRSADVENGFCKDTSGPDVNGKFHHILRKIYRRLGLRNLLPFVIIAVYTLIGAAIFLKIEQENQIENRRAEKAKIELRRRSIAENISSIIGNQTNTTDVVEGLLRDYERELVEEDKDDENRTAWTFRNALFYAGTIYTTIGYGTMYPATTLGQAVTIIYAMLGIPLVITCMDMLGTCAFVSVALVYDRLKRRTCSNKGYIPATQTPPETVIIRQSANDDEDVHTQFLKEEPSRSKIPSLDNEKEEDVNELVETEKSIPVSIALGVTFGWIFVCAGLFCIWETKWSYWKSIYFICISLTTIGLGDITPEHTGYMVAVFPLVIIGLSFVSMSVHVVEQRIVQLYVQLLMKLLRDYNKRLAAGGEQTGATSQMITAWQSSSQAKFLLPLLRHKMLFLLSTNSKRQTAVQSFQADAKAKGLEVPPVLKDVDVRSGLPTIFSVPAADDGRAEAIERKIYKAEEKLRQMVLEAKASTAMQTATAAVATQTESAKSEDDLTQTDAVLLADCESQTPVATTGVVEVQVGRSGFENVDETAQTDEMCCVDEQTQLWERQIESESNFIVNPLRGDSRRASEEVRADEELERAAEGDSEALSGDVEDETSLGFLQKVLQFLNSSRRSSDQLAKKETDQLATKETDPLAKKETDQLAKKKTESEV